MERSLDFYLFILTCICPQELIFASSHPWGLSPGGGQTMSGSLGVGEVPCCHPERCLTCSCFRIRCVCHIPSAFPPPNGNKPTKDEIHHIPESCCCPSDTPYPSIQTARSSSASRALFSARINGELLVRRSLLVTKSWSQQRCILWHKCVSQPAALPGWGGFIWALVTLQQEGHRAAGVLSLFCLGLVPFPLSSDWSESYPRGEEQLFFFR